MSSTIPAGVGVSGRVARVGIGLSSGSGYAFVIQGSTTLGAATTVGVAPSSGTMWAGGATRRKSQLVASPVAVDPELEAMVRKMLALNDRTSEALRFLNERLSAVPSVRRVDVEQSFDEMDLWVTVDGPRLSAQRSVVREACQAMSRFSGLWIKCHVMPATESDEMHNSGAAFTMISR